MSFDNGKEVKFFGWHNENFNIISLLDNGQYIYNYDKNDNIVNINYVFFSKIKQNAYAQIKNKNGSIFYDNVNIEVSKANNMIFFGKAFSLNQNTKKFNINIKGMLLERIKQLDFIKSTYIDKGFYIDNNFINLNLDESFYKLINNLYNVYHRINDFIINHKINKDLNLDLWNDDDVNKLLIWIEAIENKIPLIIPEFKTSTLGSVKIQDLRISIFAEKKENNSFVIYSIFNDLKNNHFIFTYGNREEPEQITNTKNIYLVLNKEVYMSDDININDMEKSINEYIFEKNNEKLFNLQALETIKAYDVTKREKLLDYAEFLLDKVENNKTIEDIVFINKMQIQKRRGKIDKESIKKIIKIKERNDDIFYKISANILIDNKMEARILYESLDDNLKNIFNDLPISIFL